jgi:eukaryotic-like serine/threonine-protein kinase
MTPERWQQVKEVLQGALELAPDERPVFLDQACSADPSLRQDVESLLASSDEARSSFLASTAARAALAKGTRLGDYEVQSLIGSGGMGEVYRARDRRLDREVAIKVLPPFLSSDPDRLRRFEQEARAAAALNHPNILAVFQMGTYEGAPYLVSELLDGQNLREQLRRGPLPVRKAIDHAIQIAHGLATAHDKGIVHRDLKPENLFITKDGRIKILDFGLAKLTQAKADPIATARTLDSQTEPGVVMGTVGYMAPEQVRGEAADHRADIFAFGAILYEMLTGTRAFEGASAVEIMGAILKDDPVPVSDIVPAIPPGLQRIVHRCLEKDPGQRFRTASDLAFALESLSGASDVGLAAAGYTRKESSRVRRVRIALAAALILTIGAIIGFVGGRNQEHATVLHASIAAPENALPLSLTGDEGGIPVLSPDGSILAFVALSNGANFVFVRRLSSDNALPIEGTEGASFPFWAPDNRRLGFFAQGKLKTAEVNGGGVSIVCDAANGRGGTWSRNGTILFAPNFRSPLFRVPVSGGTPQQVTTLNTAAHETTHRWPYFLPDGKHFLYTAANHDLMADTTGIYFGSLDGRENRLPLHSSDQAIYQNGYLLYVRDGQLLAQSFDPARGQVQGEARRLFPDVLRDRNAWFADFDAVGDELVKANAGRGVPPTLFDRTGKELMVVDERDATNFALSPDGQRLALTPPGPDPAVWIHDLRSRTKTRLTFSPEPHTAPNWSPDGTRIAYAKLDGSGAAHIFVKDASGASEERPVPTPDLEATPFDWSPDEKYLSVVNGWPGGHIDLWQVRVDGTEKPRRLVETVKRANSPMYSPDGKWLTYDSDDSGRSEVYVVAVDGHGGKWQLSSSGGGNPRWPRRSHEILYVAADGAITDVPVDLRGGRLQLGTPHILFRANVNSSNPGFDVSADGKLILLTPLSAANASRLDLVVNWTAELKP